MHLNERYFSAGNEEGLANERYFVESKVLAESLSGMVTRRAYDLVDKGFRIIKAVKDVEQDDSGLAQKLEIEGKLLGKLSHKAIPNVIDFYYQDNRKQAPALVMTEMVGKPVFTKLGRLDKRELIRVAGGVASALDYAAKVHGIHHGDVWPGNILESDMAVSLIDFGNTNYAPKAYVGVTPYISAPEFCATKTATLPADIYSLATTMYLLMVSHSPFEYERVGHIVDPSPFERRYRELTLREGERLEISEAGVKGLNMIFKQALCNEPRERQMSAGQLARDLASALNE